jgi:hypothetical protein
MRVNDITAAYWRKTQGKAKQCARLEIEAAATQATEARRDDEQSERRNVSSTFNRGTLLDLRNAGGRKRDGAMRSGG